MSFYEVEHKVKCKTLDDGKKIYRVKWKNYQAHDNTW